MKKTLSLFILFCLLALTQLQAQDVKLDTSIVFRNSVKYTSSCTNYSGGTSSIYSQSLAVGIGVPEKDLSFSISNSAIRQENNYYYRAGLSARKKVTKNITLRGGLGYSPQYFYPNYILSGGLSWSPNKLSGTVFYYNFTNYQYSNYSSKTSYRNSITYVKYFPWDSRGCYRTLQAGVGLSLGSPNFTPAPSASVSFSYGNIRKFSLSAGINVGMTRYTRYDLDMDVEYNSIGAAISGGYLVARRWFISTRLSYGVNHYFSSVGANLGVKYRLNKYR